MLDAHGVEYETSRSNFSIYTEWGDDEIVLFAEYVDGTMLRMFGCTPEQAIAATLGSGECELDETYTYSDAREVIHVLECSACGETCEHVNGVYPRCPHCGKAVKR